MCRGGYETYPPQKYRICRLFRGFLGQNSPKTGSKRLKNGEKGYETYLPKRRVCRYHNTREVATHKIRNTVTHG